MMTAIPQKGRETMLIGLITICSLAVIAGYQLRENVEYSRRREVEEQLEESYKHNAELADELSKSYGRIVCVSKGVMPELHKEA